MTPSVPCLCSVTPRALLTGISVGINPLRGQNNVQGSAHMGWEPAGWLDAVTGCVRDTLTATPEYKVSAVHIEKA